MNQPTKLATINAINTTNKYFPKFDASLIKKNPIQPKMTNPTMANNTFFEKIYSGQDLVVQL